MNKQQRAYLRALANVRRERIGAMSNQEVREHYTTEMVKLRMIDRWKGQGRREVRPCSYPNTWMITACKQELKLRGLPLPMGSGMRREHLPAAGEYEPPMETIAGLTVSPETDIPFGKPCRMGIYEYTIYEQSVERGYQAGIAAHLDFLHDHEGIPPVMLDDVQFTLILNVFTPKELSTRDAALWRAHFIAGWSSVFLGLIHDRKEGDAQ